MSQLQRNVTQQLDKIYKDDLWEGAIVEPDIIETPGRDVDFDLINEENVIFSRYGGTSQH